MQKNEFDSLLLHEQLQYTKDDLPKGQSTHHSDESCSYENTVHNLLNEAMMSISTAYDSNHIDIISIVFQYLSPKKYIRHECDVDEKDKSLILYLANFYGKVLCSLTFSFILSHFDTILSWQQNEDMTLTFHGDSTSCNIVPNSYFFLCCADKTKLFGKRSNTLVIFLCEWVYDYNSRLTQIKVLDKIIHVATTRRSFCIFVHCDILETISSKMFLATKYNECSGDFIEIEFDKSNNKMISYTVYDIDYHAQLSEFISPQISAYYKHQSITVISKEEMKTNCPYLFDKMSNMNSDCILIYRGAAVNKLEMIQIAAPNKALNKINPLLKLNLESLHNHIENIKRIRCFLGGSIAHNKLFAVFGALSDGNPGVVMIVFDIGTKANHIDAQEVCRKVIKFEVLFRMKRECLPILFGKFNTNTETNVLEFTFRISLYTMSIEYDLVNLEVIKLCKVNNEAIIYNNEPMDICEHQFQSKQYASNAFIDDTQNILDVNNLSFGDKCSLYCHSNCETVCCVSCLTIICIFILVGWLS